MSDAIEARGLVKRFGRTTALAGIDLTVRAGEVHGFLGPNGAGKTTTVRILLGLLRADAGSVSLLGGDPWRDVTEPHRRLAYVPGDVNLWPGLSGGETIDLLGRLRGGLDRRRRAELLERFELDPRKKGRTYSKGNRQKVALVAALASNVDLLLLDEPTSGLDPVMAEVFRSPLPLQKVSRSNQGTCLNHRVLVKPRSARRRGGHPGRRPCDRERRDGARPQRAGGVHALGGLQLRGRHPALAGHRQGRQVHLDPHRRVRDRGPGHQAGSRGDHPRHRQRGRPRAARLGRARDHLHRRRGDAGRHQR